MHDPTQDEMEVSAKVGLVAFRFSRIAAFSHRFAWELWDWSSDLGRVITAGAKVERVWDLIDAAFRSDPKWAPFVSRFEQWRDRADDLRKKRNDVIHCEWWYQITPGGESGLEFVLTPAGRDEPPDPQARHPVSRLSRLENGPRLDRGRSQGDHRGTRAPHGRRGPGRSTRRRGGVTKDQPRYLIGGCLVLRRQAV